MDKAAPVGVRAGFTCLTYDPTGGGWVILGDDLVPVSGCVVAASSDLQGNNFVTLLTAKPGALWRDYEYKRRGVQYCTLRVDGTVASVSPAVLLEAGVLSSTSAVPEKPVIPDPEPAMAAALRRAGLL